MDLFEKIKRENLILFTGETAGIVLKNRTFTDWEYAVYTFNQWKKKEIFERKWKNKKSVLNVEDLENIPFPQPFIGGMGKEKAKFEYYAAPQIEGEGIFLIHFFDGDKARAYFESIKPEFKSYIQKYKKQKLENIFKQKGWKIKQ